MLIVEKKNLKRLTQTNVWKDRSSKRFRSCVWGATRTDNKTQMDCNKRKGARVTTTHVRSLVLLGWTEKDAGANMTQWTAIATTLQCYLVCEVRWFRRCVTVCTVGKFGVYVFQMIWCLSKPTCSTLLRYHSAYPSNKVQKDRRQVSVPLAFWAGITR